jgi:hypothetical protein
VSLPHSSSLRDLFDLQEKPKGESTDYQLKGFICYSGAHYFCFFRALESDSDHDPCLVADKLVHITLFIYDYRYTLEKWTLYDDKEFR